MNTQHSSNVRARWAAAGAALAVTIGGVGLSSGLPIADAVTSSGERAIYTSITPCRLADTRSNDPVGARASALGAEETVTFAARGAQGNCTADDLPADATALALNVTAVGATAPTFLTFWDTGDRPDASSLNPTPGQPPTPNAVTTPLSPAGSFQVFNRQGQVNVIIDVVGVYTDHNHDDRYYTAAESDARYYTESESDGRYYTQAEADERFAAASPDVVTPHLLSAVPESGWTFAEGGWSSGSSEACLRFPIDAPDGRDVARIDVTYASTGPRAMTASLFGLDRDPGPFTSESDVLIRHLAGSAILPAAGTDTIALVSITDDPSELVGFPKRSTIDNGSANLEICTEDPMVVLGIDVVFET